MCVSGALVFAHKTMASEGTTICVTPENLNTILKSFGRMIDSHKYLGNACELQSNIFNGLIYNFQLSEDVCSIVQFMFKNYSIIDINILAKMYVDDQPKFAKKNKYIKKVAYQEAKNKMNSVQIKKLFGLYESCHKYIQCDSF